jgi:hypothetical protein
MLKKAGVLPFLFSKKRKGCIIMSASLFGPPRYTALAGRRYKTVEMNNIK